MKLLILHASAGGGHKRAAEALAEAAGQRGFAPLVRDILDFTSPLFRRTYAKGYLALVRSAPELWGYLYARTDRTAHRPAEQKFRTVFNHLQALSFRTFLRRLAPEAILCTHFLPLELVSTLPSRRHPRPFLGGVVTDFAAHALWFSRRVDAYYVATAEAARQLARRGQPPGTIRITGIPILPAFAPAGNAAAVRQQLGLNPRLPVVLVLNGGLGVGPALHLLRAAANDPPPCQIVIIAGRNPRLESRLRAAATNVTAPVFIHGFVENLHDFMEAADLVVTKPGGLTVAEALSKGRPLLLMDPIPGQEQRNAEYLLEAGAAVRAFEPEEALWKITHLLQSPARLAQYAATALGLGRPNAAADILADLCGRVAISHGQPADPESAIIRRQ